MSFATKKAAIIKWLEISSGYPIGKVIWDNQNMPRPVKPYIVARMSSFVNKNREYLKPQTNTNAAKFITHKEFTLTIHCYSEGSTDPLEKMLNIQDSLLTEKTKSIFEPEQLVSVDILKAAVDTTIKLDTTYERRATMDILMRIPWTIEDHDQGLIEAVSIEGLALNVDGTTIMKETFLVGTSFTPVDISLDDMIFVSVDILNETVIFKTTGNVPYTFTYVGAEITINTVPSLITDLIVDDTADLVYFEYNGHHNLKTVTVVRT
jgi:hypothetical protein